MPNKKVELSRNARELLDLVPPDGTFIGNTTLQRRSKLGKGYWKVQKELVSKGVLTRGKGRGGSVARLAVEEEVGQSPQRAKVQSRRNQNSTSRLGIGWPRNGGKMLKGVTSLRYS